MCRVLLRAPENLKDQKRYLQAVQKVIAYMTIGVDVSKLFSDMIMVSEGINGEAGRLSHDLHMHVTCLDCVSTGGGHSKPGPEEVGVPLHLQLCGVTC